MIQEITIKARLIVELNTKEDWINKIPKRLPEKTPGEHFLFIDKNGNTLELGVDFRIAECDDTFPIKVYRTQSVSRKFNEID